MKIRLLLAYCLLSTAYCFAQLPDCDIFLLDIKDSAGNVSFHNPVNITNRKGYDNQPAFSPDGKYLFYTSQRDSNGQTDIFKYDLKTKTVSQFTKTATSEYSPTFTPDGKFISVVMVEKDSAQRVWKFPLAGGEPVCLSKNMDSVGYHAWISKELMAVDVLTKPGFTLQVFNVTLQKPIIVADSIGRCMRMKGGKLWFTTQSGHFWNVYEYWAESKVKTVLQGIIESEDYCFYKKDVWSISDNTIIAGFMNTNAGAQEIVDLSAFGITKPTRISLSPDGKRLAVVSNK